MIIKNISFQNITLKNIKSTGLTLFIGGTLLLGSQFAYSQAKSLNSKNIESNKIEKTDVKIINNIFPDNYTELDDNIISPDNLEKDGVEKIIFEAKKKYHQAIDFKRRKDTVNAVLYFDKALTQLNTLISIQDIDRNERFYDLTQQIIEEYESLVTNLEDFNENTPLFVIRDKFFKDLEKTNLPFTTGLENRGEKKHIAISTGGFLCQPDMITIPMDQNEYVLKNIQYLTQTKARRFFTKWLERSGRYLPMMKQIAKEEGVPEEIVYLSMIESGLDPNAVSKASAVGLWQFMRPTGLDYNLNNGGSKWIDERRDPEKATRAAMKYLGDLYNMFGDWHLALASYNCGQGRVAKAIKKSNKKNPNYWDIRDILPLETRFYVSHYIATATIAMNPECYGFSLDSIKFQSKYEYDTYELKETVNLETLAKCLDADVNLIKAYNPELIKLSTPLDMSSYKLKIPKESYNSFAAKFSILTDEEKRPWISYEVQNRENIASIAKKFQITEEEIIAVNDFSSSKTKLKRGTELRLPITLEKFNEITQASATNPEYPLDGSSDVFHIVKKGESLFSISRKYGISLGELKDLNNLDEKRENVLLGQQLIIAQKENKDQSIFKKVNSISKNENLANNNKSEVEKQIKHKVKKGETLARIADVYGVNIADIKSLNKIKRDKVKIGDELIIEPDAKNRTKNNSDFAEDVEINRKSTARISSAKTSIHKVKKGETIGMIAAKYGVSEEEIKSLNSDVIEGNTIFAGTKLKVANEDNKGSANAENSKINKLPNYYTIKNGETLSGIARKFGVPVSTILKKNKQLDENKIKSGQQIRLQ